MAVPPPHESRPALRLVLSISFSLFIFLSLLSVDPASAKPPLSGKRHAFSPPPEPRRVITPPSAPRGEVFAPSKSSRSLPSMPDEFWDDLIERNREERSGYGGMSSANNYGRRKRDTRAEPPKPACLYVSGYSSEVKRGVGSSDGKLYLFNDVGDYQSQHLTAPMALGVDYHTDTLYVSTSSSIDQIEIGRNMSNGDKYCTCSFSTKEVDVFDIQTLDVNQVDGGVYFGFHNEICFKPNNASSASCWVWPTSLVPDNEEFKYIYINQHSQKLYALSSIAMWVYYFEVNPNASLWLGGLWGSPGYLNTYARNAKFTGVASRDDSDEIYLSLPSFNYVDTDTGDTKTSSCLVVEASLDVWTMSGCWIPEPGLQADQIYEPFFLYYYEGYFYTFIPNAPPGGGTDTTNALLRMDLQPKAEDDSLLEMADDWDWFIDQISSPTDLLWAPCPYLPSPTPSPRALSASGDGLSTAAIIAPVVLGSLLGLFVVGLIVGILAWNYYRKRRKYYAGQELCSDEIELGMVKFTYREIEYQDLKLGRLLGEGAFGKVYKGEYRGAVVAVKMFEALRLDQADDKVLNELRMEAQMMERLSNHPNIVKFVGAITRGNEGANFALVTEFCSRGSLFDLLVKKKKKLPLITLVRMARDAASGILHLHKEHIVHRDIAARNILVGQNYEVYVADFGLARAQEAEGQVATTKQNFGPISWMAPEALRSREYSEATDAFSFGVLLWEMMERKRPWAGMEAVQIVTAVTTNTRLKIPKDCDPVFQRLMKMCWRQNPAHRPSFEKMVNTLSDYYKTLKQYQDADADAFEASGKDTDDEPEDLGEGMSYEEWQARRIKDEVKSFMKQLITERNDDYNTVAGAAAVALHELRSAFGVEGEEAETVPLLGKKQSSGQLSRSKPLKDPDAAASGKKIIYDSLNESKAKKMGLKKNKKKEKTGEEEEEEEEGEDDGDIQFTGESMRYAGAEATSAGSILDSSMYMGLDEVAKGGESNKNLEREDSGELVRKRKSKTKQIASASSSAASSSSYASLSASELSAPSNQTNATSPAGASPRGDAAPGEAEAGDEDQIYLFQANAETDEEREKENENESEKAKENEGEEEAEAEAEAEGKGGAKKSSKNPLKKSLEAMKKLSERSLRKTDSGGLKRTMEKNMEKNEKRRGKSEQALRKRETKKAEAERKKSQQEPKKSADADQPAPPVAAPPQQQWLAPEKKVKVSSLGSSIREQDSFYASILDSKQSLALGSDDDSDNDSSSDSDSD